MEKAKRKGEELYDICVPVEQEVVRTRLDNLESRYQALADKTASKQGKLSRALASNEVFGEGEASLLRWLTETERKLAKLEPISIYPDRTRQQLREHRVQYTLTPTPHTHRLRFWFGGFLAHPTDGFDCQ